MANNHRRGRGPMGGGMHGGMNPAEKAKDFKGTMKKLFHYLGSYKIGLAAVLIFAAASTIFTIVGPKILGNATTEIFNGVMSKFSGGSGINFGAIGQILIFLICIYILSAVLSFIQGLIMSTITQKVGYKMRDEISKKIHRLPMNFFDKRQTGDVLSVITNDVDTFTTGLNQCSTQLITSVTTIIGILIMMFSMDVILTLIALITLPISFFIISKVIKKSQKHFTNQQNYLGEVNGQIEETFSGSIVVQAFNHEEDNIKEFENSNSKLYSSAWKSQFLSGLMMPIMQFIGNLSYVVIAVLGGYFAISGRITVGNIQSFIQYVRQFTQPIQQIAQISNMMQSMAAAAERVFIFLEEEEEQQTAENHAEYTKTEVTEK